ncbi:MAG: hypothetical protein V2I97_12720 [Desulfococcaceae bacterium]|jgi:hypothetical protein|nr:hypothetical protein [Desulfococcaceae bacterium]
MEATVKTKDELSVSGEIPLKYYPFTFSINCLRTGIDNIRYDVRLSEIFSKALGDFIFRFMLHRMEGEGLLHEEEIKENILEKEEFIRLCREIMLSAVNRAKQENEMQIDFLAQAAIIKLVQKEISRQYEKISDAFRNTIRKYETANRTEDASAAKKKLGNAELHRGDIISDTGKTLFAYMAEAQHPDVNEMRRINFGNRAVIPEDFWRNPMICAASPSDDIFMLEEYSIILGHRVEDPDKYDNLIAFFQEEFRLFPDRQPDWGGGSGCEAEAGEAVRGSAGDWLKHKDNVDVLFNCFQTQHQCRVLKKKGADNSILKQQAEKQRKNLQRLYRKFRKAGLMKRIIAAYEMQPVYREYCPPLVPQLILQYFISFRMRRSLHHRVRKLNRFHGKPICLLALRKARRRMWGIGKINKKGYLIRFIKDLSAYHRDRVNFQAVRKNTEAVNLLRDEKKCNLSRANHCLYEFLFPHEQGTEEKPIINHVILKADVRGSTDITYRMMKQQLNPASYFSLNFFDPITEILPEYGAEKVFVEGDAIILSIFEYKDSPEGWYSVARACGLATKILSIVRQCNMRNHKNRLPIIELGIGITYSDKSPTFLFDGEHRIMISSAINLADRLSGCSKLVRKQMLQRKKTFNLYVFQMLSDEEMENTSDDFFHRYNVNGIELNAGGFEKLRAEIDLKPVQVGIKALEKNRVRLYTGEFPTVTRSSRRLIIRESRIPKVNPRNFSVSALTRKKYYEVCTNPKLHEHVEKIVNRL